MRVLPILFLLLSFVLGALAHRDFYEILSVSKDAGEDEIKKSYRKLSRKLHPG